MDKTYRNRFLAERSNLLFEYPLPNGRTAYTYLPMLENPDISEGKKANYANYDLIGRSNSLYAYTGAKSRSINVRFNITLPNVIEYLSKDGLSEYFKGTFSMFDLDKDTQRKVFLKGDSGPNDTGDFNPTTKKSQAQLHREYFERLLGISTGVDTTPTLFDNVIDQLGISNSTQNNAVNSDKRLMDTINLVVLWINMVRSCTSNNAKNSTLGPPVIRINHGIMFNNVPTICTTWGIRILNSGYELATMTPRQVEISMALDEIRQGNFQEFKAFAEGSDIAGDNNAGWEAVLDVGTMDPYNGQIH